MKVRDLITQLLQCDMDEEVFIGLGPYYVPSDHSGIHSVADHSEASDTNAITAKRNCPFGVYVVPTDHIVNVFSENK